MAREVELFIPCNRHLLVEPVEQERDTSGGVMLPEGYKSSSTNQFKLVKLIEVAPDSDKFNGEVGHTLVVASHMLQEIEVGETKYFLIPENMVVGVFAPEA